MKNVVYIAASLDGYIADGSGKVDFLNNIPNPNDSDFGFSEFISGIDAVIMGRKTFDVVVSFGGEWVYPKPVYVLSNTLKSLPDYYKGKVEVISGDIVDIVYDLNKKGLVNLYVDGGSTIQSFLKKDMIDEMIISTIPVLLGDGISLFGRLDTPLIFKHYKTEVLLDVITKNYYRKN